MKKLVGLFASVALMTSGAALAFQDQQGDVSGSSVPSGQSGMGGSGSTTGSGATGSQSGSMGQQGAQQGGGQQGQMGSGQQGQDAMGSQLGGAQAMSGSEVNGSVIKSDRRTIYLKQADGAVVQLKVDKKTQFNDPNMKSARDLQPGSEIRANFEVKGTDNMALSIQPSQSGMGGSGDVLSPDTGINQGGSMPGDIGGSGNVDPGPGGALPDDTGGSGTIDPGASDMDKDVGSDINSPSGEKNY